MCGGGRDYHVVVNTKIDFRRLFLKCPVVCGQIHVRFYLTKNKAHVPATQPNGNMGQNKYSQMNPSIIQNGKKTALDFQIGSKKIPYLIGSNCLNDFASTIAGLRPDKVFVITDENISALYKHKIHIVFELHFRCEWLLIESGEPAKKISTVSSLCSRILHLNCTRNSLIVPLGGGVVGNIGGLIASLLFRGIRFAHMPTTLLAMHDSVTSCKQAVNHARSKNILGTYYSPEVILTDVLFLQTLSPEHIKSGKAELVKNALIFGGKQYTEILELISFNNEAHYIRMIELGVAAKSNLLRKDPLEKGQAIVFEYGHTIGHAIELYFEGKLTHGKSIAHGMKYAAIIAHHLGLLSGQDLEMHQALIEHLALELSDKIHDIEKLIALILKDNKRGYTLAAENEVPMLLLKGIGEIAPGKEHPSLTNVPVSLIKQVLLETNKTDLNS